MVHFMQECKPLLQELLPVRFKPSLSNIDKNMGRNMQEKAEFVFYGPAHLC